LNGCAKAHSGELAQSVVEALEEQKEQLQHHAIATLIPPGVRPRFRKIPSGLNWGGPFFGEVLQITFVEPFPQER
jgi:hypothetical protein